jgi:hypothetical protein
MTRFRQSAYCSVFLVPHHCFKIASFPFLLDCDLEIQYGWMLQKENRQDAFNRIDKFVFKVETFQPVIF